MPLYEYQALSEKGKKYRAMIDAKSLKEAETKLFVQKRRVFSLRQVKEKGEKEALNKEELLQFTREISRLLQASLPLYEALCALREKYSAQKIQRLLLFLADQIQSGSSFAMALAKRPKSFDLLYVSMVLNGEKSGTLKESLEELSDLIGRQIAIKKQLVSALLYPALLFSFCFIVLFSLFFYVIPSLKDLFDGRDLHPFTKVVFSISDFVNAYQGSLFLLAMGSILGGLIGLSRPAFRKKGRKIACRLPFFKKVLERVALVRFSRAMATLLDGGVPILEAIDQAKDVMKHPLLEEAMERVKAGVEEGEKIYSCFEKEAVVPPLIPRMVAIAEEGGSLPFMMKQIGGIYEEELERMLTRFGSAIQPVLLLVLGCIIGFVLLSVLLPLTDVSSFAIN